MNISITKQISTLVLFIIIIFGIYSNTLDVPFHLDDRPMILENPQVRISTLSEIGKVGFESAMTRPVAFISFALNYYVHQYDLKGYHVVNITIHILTGIFLYLFMITTIAISTPQSAGPQKPGSFNPSPIAFGATLIWLVHPVQTQSVTYIVQRMTSMASMFYLLSFLLYAKGRILQRAHPDQTIQAETDSSSKYKNITNNFRRSLSSLYFSCAVMAWLLALGSKQTSATLPFFIFLYEWYFFQNLSKDWLKKHLKYVLVVFILFSFIALIYLGFNPLERIKSIGDYAHKEFTFTERLFSQFRVVIYYLSLIFYPHPSRLNLDYDFPLSHSLIDPSTTLLSLFIITVLVAFAFYTAKKERLISFCILWYLGNLVIESSVIPLAIIFEHRTYMPSMFVCLLLVLLGARHIKQKWLLLALFGVIVMTFSVWTYERNQVWSDRITLWKDCVKKSPNKVRPHFNLGVAFEDKGFFKNAIHYYSDTLKINPTHYKAHYNLGNILLKENRKAEAINHFSKALKIKPDYSKAHINIANALAEEGKFKESVPHFLEVLSLKPNNSKAHYNLGLVLAKTGRLSDAINHFSKAVQLDPENLNMRNSLRKAIHAREKIKAEIREAEREMNINEDPNLYNRLGNLYKSLGESMTAIKHYKKALSIQPNFPPALNNLAILYVSRKEYDQALPLFKQIIKIVPDHPGTYYNIACIYALQNKLEDATSWLKAAIQKGYDNWELIKTDKDLENIRRSPYYKAIIKEH